MLLTHFYLEEIFDKILIHLLLECCKFLKTKIVLFVVSYIKIVLQQDKKYKNIKLLKNSLEQTYAMNIIIPVFSNWKDLQMFPPFHQILLYNVLFHLPNHLKKKIATISTLFHTYTYSHICQTFFLTFYIKVVLSITGVCKLVSVYVWWSQLIIISNIFF